ncbi:MAG: hypothetical protein MUC35_01250 [Candidatus Margulisbacteria bacterium]|jgi:hypothetical protein|nr:hypothetical protein [Candidatus Margulisiibacteriota bacterium]
MRRVCLATFALIVIGGAPCLPAGRAQAAPFAELWNNLAYYDTNVERRGFSSLLGRFEGKFGFNLLESPLQFYGAYYCTASQAPDYWDNAVYYGPGIRFKPFAGFESGSWATAWLPDLKIYAETLSARYFKDQVSGEANRRTDTRYGFDLWHEWNLDNPDPGQFWGEVWSNLSYRSTNFSWTDFNGYLFYCQPKLGRHLGKGIEAYVKLDLTMSSKNDYWLNTADYGLGLRFEPWRSAFQTGEDSLLKKFKMFVEALSVSYLRDKPTDPNKTVASDFRFGIDFSYGR